MTDVATEPEGSSTSAPARSASTAVLAAVAVLLLVADITLAAVWMVHRSHRSAIASARADAVAAARQELVNLDSLSAATIDKDLAEVLAGTTGTFRDQFQRSKDDLKALVVQHKTKSRAVVRSAGVVRADTSTATVLVATDRTVADSTTPQGQVVNERWSVSMEKHGGRWLVADLQPVS